MNRKLILPSVLVLSITSANINLQYTINDDYYFPRENVKFEGIYNKNTYEISKQQDDIYYSTILNELQNKNKYHLLYNKISSSDWFSKIYNNLSLSSDIAVDYGIN